MHPNPAFRDTPADRNLAFARQRGFGLLCVNDPAGPLIAHVPFLMVEGGLTLHLARSNPIARAALPIPAVMAVSGPDAYISPDWYGVPDQVPTWNYVAVHLRGTLSPLPIEALRDQADGLSAEFEARLPKRPWTSAKMGEGVMERMMRGILPFRLEIEDVQGTWKLNQNKTTEARAGVIAALEQGDPAAVAIAALMRGLDDPSQG
jgi:transcriptional regulator